MAWITILILVMVDLSICKNVNTFPDSFSEIKTELTKLKQRVNDLEIVNADQIKKTIYLERENEAKTKTILHLENELDSFKQLTSDLLAKHGGSHRTIGKLDTEHSNVTLKSSDDSEIDEEKEVHNYRNVTDMLKSGYEQKIDSRMQVRNPKMIEDSISHGETRQQLAERVAFTAMASTYHYGPLRLNEILKFDNVITNMRNAYHPYNGTFVAPVDGVYMFFATIAGSGDVTSDGYVHFVLNGNWVNKILVANVQQSSQMLILNLRAYDQVYLTNGVDYKSVLGVTYSSFSGVLLFPV